MPPDDTFLEQLALRLQQPLPGMRRRGRFAPELSYGRHEGPPAWNARPAAVLLLLFPCQQRWYLPLTRRPESLAAHAGQVSLPGGAIESGENPEQAATRELHEELGVVPDDLRILGRLTPIYVFATNFLVTPCVAATRTCPQFEPNPAEVAHLLQIPLDALTESVAVGRHTIRRRGIEFEAPHFDLAGHLVWGATSLILAEFAELLASGPLGKEASEGGE